MVSSWQRSFFPSLPGLVLNDVQQLNWEWNHQFGEISNVMVGSQKKRKKKWNWRPLASSPFTVVALLGTLLLWGFKCLLFCWASQSWREKTFKTVTVHRSPPTLPCSRKPSSFSKSEANILQPSSSSPPLQSNSPSQTWFFEMQLPSRQENSSCFGLKIWNIAQQMIVSYKMPFQPCGNCSQSQAPGFGKYLEQELRLLGSPHTWELRSPMVQFPVKRYIVMVSLKFPKNLSLFVTCYLSFK